MFTGDFYSISFFYILHEEFYFILIDGFDGFDGLRAFDGFSAFGEFYIFCKIKPKSLPFILDLIGYFGTINFLPFCLVVSLPIFYTEVLFESCKL